MKKTILMGIAALMICGTVNATSWRVCSKPEAGANFLSVAAAVASNSVFAGDTLYVEPGHFETNNININKLLHIIGPGFFFLENNINVMDERAASFGGDVTFEVESSSITGCSIFGRLSISPNVPNVRISHCSITIEDRNNVTAVSIGGPNSILEQCYIVGNVYLQTTSWMNSGNPANSIIQNNIIEGAIASNGTDNFLVIRNNTIVDDGAGISFDANYQTYFFADGITNSEIYNNIILRRDDRFITVTNSNQTVDTFYAKDYLFSPTLILNNTIYNNVLSCKTVTGIYNCIFNSEVDNILIWNNANTLEEKYKHIANGPAVGAGVNGTTCGAYGQVNGGRAYQPAGIPQYRPYIYDANIDDTPTNNTINASFKIKVQQ